MVPAEAPTTTCKGDKMAAQSTQSSHPALSQADGLASSTADVLLLIGRVLLGWLFLASSAGFGGKLWNVAGFAGYLRGLKVPSPDMFAWPGAVVEFLIGACLILGLATRYAALLCAVFLVVATALAHRYWEYPAAGGVQQGQYNNFLKNLALFGGALIIFVTGAGRISLDWLLSKKR
jgi:putative oxidoreductase